MKIAIFYRVLYKTTLLMFFIQSFLFSQGYTFVHSATNSNIIGATTVIDLNILNGAPNSIFFITQNNKNGVLDNSPIGVYYENAESKWTIANENFQSMPLGATFNVFYPGGGTTLYVHYATASNTSLNLTTINHPALNGNPNAIFFITQNFNLGGGNYVANNSPTGVVYTDPYWAIINLYNDPIPIGAGFNLFINPPASDAFIHTATNSNTSGIVTIIDHLELNGNPNAIFFVTQNVNPYGGSFVVNPHPIALVYNVGYSKWTIINLDSQTIPIGSHFNIYLALTQIQVLPVEDQNVVMYKKFLLKQNYPNPFNPSTTINYSVPELSNVVIKVYDVLGKETATLVNEQKPAGSYEVEFDASNLVSGVYLYKLQAGSFVETKKMILMK